MRASVRLGVAGALLVSVAAVQAASVNVDNGDYEYRPTGKGWGELVPVPPGIDVKNQAAKGARPQGSNGINYRGGPVMTNALGNTVYYIWYGNWGNNSAQTILTDFAQNIGGSPYFNINTTYYDAAGKYVKNIIALGGSYLTSAYLGNSLTDAQIKQVVSDAIGAGKLPANNDAVYFVLTSSEVTASSGFCTQYCGWHTHASMTFGTTYDIKYSFVGNPDRCPSACSAQTTSPNGNAGADGMASIIAHELEEAATDPDLNAWYDSRGYENADKCAWNFGATTTAADGSKSNMTLGSRKYLIQQNWLNASGGKCALAYP